MIAVVYGKFLCDTKLPVVPDWVVKPGNPLAVIPWLYNTIKALNPLLA